MTAALSRGEPLDHVLLYGPPGLGKTTLAGIVSTTMGGNMRTTSAPVIQKAGDLASLLVSLEDGDVLFIDEIHRLAPIVEESIYGAMEDRCLDMMIGEGSSAKPITIDLPKFTIVGATTRIGSISKPLRDRFGIAIRLEFYSPEELALVVVRAAAAAGESIGDDAALEIGKRARGTPRIAGNLYRRIRDFSQVASKSAVDVEIVDVALGRLGIDPMGLTATDMRYLEVMATHHRGGPVGADTMAVAIAEPKDSLEDVIEPFLVRQGLVMRGPRGRSLTDGGWKHLGLDPPERVEAA